MKKICTYVILIALNVICYQNTKAQNKPNLSETFPQGVLLNTDHLRSVDYTDPGIGNRKFNFERVWVPQVPISDANAISETTNPEICTESTSYVDGNGNPLQTIGRYGVSPTRHVIGISDVKSIVNNQYSYPAYTVPATSGSEKFHFNAFTEQENYYLSLYPNEGRTAYTLESDQFIGGKKIKNTFSMGKSRVGQLRSTVKTVEVSSIINLPILEINTGTQLPEFNGYYSVGEIYEEKLAGQHNNEIIKYTNAEGRVIANFKLADVTTGVYQKTYYVYDHLGRNVYTILPKASELLEANSWSITTQILVNLCSHTVYDDLGRVSETYVPSVEGRQQMVYDISGRAVMSQTPKLEDEGKWTFTIYDVMGRVAFSGITTINEPREYWQYILDGTGTLPTGSTMPIATTLADPNEIYYYLLNEINLIQNGGSYPNNINNCEINSYNYYDHYNYSEFVGMEFNQGHSAYFYHDATSLANATPFALSPFSTMGATTGTKTRVLKPFGTNTTLDDWKISVVYYDKMGRVIQARDKMIDDVSPFPISYTNTISTSYDWSGKVLRMIDENARVGMNGTSLSNIGSNIVTTKFEYEPKTFKLLKVSQKPNNQNWMLISQNTYNPITGAVQTKNIGDVETQALTYNIRGQLTGINPYYAEHGIPGPKVTFGESIKYDYGFTENRLDGKIAGIIWKTPSSGRRAYGYSYNQAGYMTNGEFSQLDGINPLSPNDWDKQQVDLSESNLTYDVNGNIKTLLRRGIGQSGTPETVDDLVYNYESADESNRLESINDASAFLPINPNIEKDFQDHNLGSSDYEYDKHGNIIKDKNKLIDLITYNEFNKPIKIQFHNGSTIENVYASSGEKLVEIKNVISQPSQTKYFNGSYEFVNRLPTTMNQPEGRARLNLNSTSGTYDFVYDFMIKDHLGNVRTTLTAEQIPFQDYFADHEIAYANIENLFFENIDNVRASKLGSTTEKVARLSANDPTKRIGTALLLHVMAGDKFNINADAFYNENTTPTGNSVSADAMLQSIVTTLTGNQTGFNNDGGNTVEVVNSVFTEPNYLQAYTELKDNLTDPNKAKAYINYLVFDENFHIITNQSGAIQVNTANAWHNLSTLNDITINQGGYLSVYISNEDLDNVVEFDKLHITYTKGKLLEENHYYPYGMCLRLSQDQTTLENKKLYQTKEFITDENMNIYDFDARQYDPLLGRFTSIDPLGEFASGYVGMGNNPVMGVDPTGMATNLGGNGVDFDNRVAVFKMKEGIANYRKQLLIDAQNSGLNQDYSMQEFQRYLDNAWATEEQYQKEFIANAQAGFNQMERMRYERLHGEAPPQYISTDDLGKMNDNKEESLEKAGAKVIGDENTTVHRSDDVVREGGRLHLPTFISYSGDLSCFDEVFWFQTVSTSSPTDGNPNNQFVDVITKDMRFDIPEFNKYIGVPLLFYDEPIEIQINAEKKFKEAGYTLGDKNYYDKASRSEDKSFGWVANLSLIGINSSGNYERIITYQYGFYNNRETKGCGVIPFSVIQYPSPFHIQVLNNPNPYRH